VAIADVGETYIDGAQYHWARSLPRLPYAYLLRVAFAWLGS
jgi:hypothetical protein